MADMEKIFMDLNKVISDQQKQIAQLRDHIEQLDLHSGGGGGGGSASIEDYESDKLYKRNTLLVDPSTETVYRVIDEYTSVTVTADCTAGHLKLVGFESQIVTFNHLPTQAELDVLPEDTLVAIYSSTDAPYTPVLDGD